MFPIVLAGIVALAVAVAWFQSSLLRADRETVAVAAFSMVREYAGRAQPLGPGLSGQQPPFRHLPIDASPMTIAWEDVGDRDSDGQPDCDTPVNAANPTFRAVACDCDLSVDSDANGDATDDNDGLSDADGATRCLRVDWSAMEIPAQRAMAQYMGSWTGRPMPDDATVWLGTWEALPDAAPDRLRRASFRPDAPGAEAATMVAPLDFADGASLVFCRDCLDPAAVGTIDPPPPPPTLVAESLSVTNDVVIRGDVEGLGSAGRNTVPGDVALDWWHAGWRTFAATAPGHLDATSDGSGLFLGEPLEDDSNPATVDFGCPTCGLDAVDLTVEDDLSHSVGLSIDRVLVEGDADVSLFDTNGQPFAVRDLVLDIDDRPGTGNMFEVENLSAGRLCGSRVCPEMGLEGSPNALIVTVTTPMSVQTLATGRSEDRDITEAFDLKVEGDITAGTVFWTGDLCAGDTEDIPDWVLCGDDDDEDDGASTFGQ